MIGSFGKIRLGSPDQRWCLLAAITRSQYLATSRLVGSPEPLGALARWSRAIVQRLSPRFTLCGLGLLGWASSPGPCREPVLPPPPEPPDDDGGGCPLGAGVVPAVGNR